MKKGEFPAEPAAMNDPTKDLLDLFALLGDLFRHYKYAAENSGLTEEDRYAKGLNQGNSQMAAFIQDWIATRLAE